MEIIDGNKNKKKYTLIHVLNGDLFLVDSEMYLKTANVRPNDGYIECINVRNGRSIYMHGETKVKMIKSITYITYDGEE